MMYIKVIGIEMTRVPVPTVCPYCGAGCGLFTGIEKLARLLGSTHVDNCARLTERGKISRRD